MEKYINILKKSPLFNQIEDKNIPILLKCLGAKVESFDKKYTIIAEGTPAKYIGIVLSGSVQIIQIDYLGNRSIISEISESEVFGEAFACAESSAIPVSIIANKPSKILLINCSHILHTCNNNCGFHQQLIFNLMKDIAQKTILFHQKIEIVSRRSTKDKLMTYLMIYAKKVGKNEFKIPFDRQELADYLEVDRSGLSAEISKLKQEGIIESEKNYFKLL